MVSEVHISINQRHTVISNRWNVSVQREWAADNEGLCVVDVSDYY